MTYNRGTHNLKYKPRANAKAIADLDALQLTVPAGAVHWVNGLQGSAADVRNDAAFTLQQRVLANGETLALGAQGRSSEQTVPWFAVDGEQDEFFAALMWSGAWSLSITRGRSGLEVSFGLAPMTTSMTGPCRPCPGRGTRSSPTFTPATARICCMRSRTHSPACLGSSATSCGCTSPAA